MHVLVGIDRQLSSALTQPDAAIPVEHHAAGRTGVCAAAVYAMTSSRD
jgi:hypothetical protein